MSHHEGVSCDSCMKGNFRGRRYKCLICFDYDSCSSCYENGVTSNRHTTDHPMQCILTRSDFELFYGGETIPQDVPQSFTCPFCGRHGLTESSLQEHVSSDHSDSSSEVICAICASIPGGEANNVTDDFAAHLQLEHRTPRELEEPQTAIRGRRAPHPSRSSLNSSRSSRRGTQMQMQYSSVGLTALSPGSAAAAAASGSGGSSASGASARDMDPIAELLSQLSGVRRAANQSNSSQLQQLQMQLQLERHTSVPSLARQGFAPAPGSINAGVGSDRVPIERVIRRHQQQQQHPSSSNNNSHNVASSQITHHQQQHVNHLMGAASVAGNPDMPYIVLMEQNPNLNPLNVNALANGQSNMMSASSQTTQSSCSGRFLLSGCNETNLSESELASAEIAQADKSLFVQELLLTTLSDSAPPVLHVNEKPVPVKLTGKDPLRQQRLHEQQPIQRQELDTSGCDYEVATLGLQHQPEPQDHEEDEDAVQVFDDAENREPVISEDECEGLDTSEDVIISPEDKDTENRDDGLAASDAAARTKVHQSSPADTALRSSDNLPPAAANMDSDGFANINFESLLMNDNDTTPFLTMSQSQQLQRPAPTSTTSTTSNSLSNAPVKNRNIVPSVANATPAAPATSVVHPLMLNTCQTPSSSPLSAAAASASSQPHVQITSAPVRSSQSQSTWTGPTAVRRRTVNNELHNLSRNSSSRSDRSTGASASGPTHPLKRGLSQPQTSPAPPQET